MKRRTTLISVLYPCRHPFSVYTEHQTNTQANWKAVYGSGAATLRLAIRTPGELGLVEVLAEAFNQMHDTRLYWQKAGSRASLKRLKGKAVDVVMVHAPAAEKQAVADGWAIKRNLIGSNEFYFRPGIADRQDAWDGSLWTGVLQRCHLRRAVRPLTGKTRLGYIHHGCVHRANRIHSAHGDGDDALDEIRRGLDLCMVEGSVFVLGDLSGFFLILEVIQ
jgi:hypothetical protein